MAKEPDITPEAKELADAAINQAKATKGGGETRAADASADKKSSEPRGRSDDSRSTSDGSSINNPSGGFIPPGNPSPSVEETNPGGNMKILGMSPRLFMVSVGGFITSLAMVYMTMWRVTPEGQKLQTEELSVEKAQIALEQDKQKRLLVRDLLAAGVSVPASLLPAPLSASKPSTAPAAPSNCLSVGDSDGKTRATAVVLSFGKCLTFQARGTKKHFYLVLASPPESIVGSDASFGHLREQTPEDRAAGRAVCMGKTNDAEYCDAEAQKPYGVRVDDCVTRESPDRCLSYLRGKTSIPIAVATYGTVTINMK